MRTPAKILRRHHLILALVWLVLYLMLFSPWSGGGCDQTYYYVYLSSLLHDGDLDVANDFCLSANSSGTIRDSILRPGPLGAFVDRFPIGNALLWAPFVAPVRLVGLVAGIAATAPPGWSADRFSRPYCMAASLGTVCYGFLALVLMYHVCRACFRPRDSLLAALGVAVASPLLAYTFGDPAMSHAQSAFCAALLIFLCFRHRRFDSLQGYLLISGALGLASLVRWQDITLGVIPAAFWIQAARQGRLSRRRMVAIAGLAAGGAILALLISLQLVYWKTWFGAWITMPQGDAYMQWKSPAIIDVLFSGWHGLYYWHPLLLVATIGLIVWAVRSRRNLIPISMAAYFLLSVYINASPWDWFGNASFGARRFCTVLPILALGLAAVFSRFRGASRILPPIFVTVASIANVLLVTAFVRRMFDPFFVSDLWNLREQLFWFPNWAATALVQSDAAAMALLNADCSGAMVIVLPGVVLICGLAFMMSRIGVPRSRKFATWLLMGLCASVILLNGLMLLGKSHPTKRDARLAEIISGKVSLQEAGADLDLSQPAASFLLARDSNSTATLQKCLDGIRDSYPRLWSDWILALAPGVVSDADRKAAAELTDDRSIYVPSRLASLSYEARVKGDLALERAILERGFRYNPFDMGIQDRLIESYNRKEARRPSVDRLKAFQRKVLEGRADLFFSRAGAYPGRQHALYGTFFAGPIRSLIELNRREGRTTETMEIYRKLDNLKLLGDSDRQEWQKLQGER
ncbi:MAG: hypothetical protein K1X53_07995 [Candidatus Sumerlaeaceae bacterium]|nr:hypothetical protein [Candidatus Sumerlaeaceae bacterium]